MADSRAAAAVSQGAVGQMRILGGVVGLAICTAVASESIQSKLHSTISEAQLESLLQSSLAIAELPPAEQEATRSAYGSVYNTQMQIVMGFALASFAISLFTFERHPRSLEEVHRSRNDGSTTPARSKEER